MEWPEWSGFFYVAVHQKPIRDTEKMQYLKKSVAGQAKAAISGMGFSSQSYYHAWDKLWEVWQIRCHSQRTIQENTYSSLNSPRWSYEHRQVFKCGYKCGEHLHSTWIHIRQRSRSRANFNNKKTFFSTERTGCSICKTVDYWEATWLFLKSGLPQSSSSWELVSTDKFVVWQKKISMPW